MITKLKFEFDEIEFDTNCMLDRKKLGKLLEATIEVEDSFYDLQEFKVMLNGRIYKEALEEVWNYIFRPHRKHGYGDPILDKGMENGTDIQSTNDVIEALIDRHQEVIEEMRDKLIGE